MSKHISSRRDLLKHLSSLAAIGAFGNLGFMGDAFSQSKKAFAGKTLKMFVYSGTWEKAFRETFAPAFEEFSGAKVVIIPGWWDSIPKLKASPKNNPAFDLVLTDATQGYPGIREGLFQKIDLAQVPNWKTLAASTTDHWVVKDSYGVTFPDSAMTLAYNKNMVKEAPKNWGDLLNPANVGKIGLYNSFYMSLYTFAAIKAAKDGKPGTAHELMNKSIEEILNFAKEHKKDVKYWWPTSTDMVVNLAQKNCALGNMHSVDVVAAVKTGKGIEALVPEHDKAYVQLMWVVASGTKEKALAETAMNFICSEEMQYRIARYGSCSANVTSAKRLAAEDKVWAQFYPGDEKALAAVQYYPYDAYMKNWEHIASTWDKQILRS